MSRAYRIHICSRTSFNITCYNSRFDVAFILLRWEAENMLDEEAWIYKRRQRWHNWWAKFDQRSESRLDLFGVPRCIWNWTIAINESAVEYGEGYDHSTYLKPQSANFYFESVYQQPPTLLEWRKTYACVWLGKWILTITINAQLQFRIRFDLRVLSVMLKTLKTTLLLTLFETSKCELHLPCVPQITRARDPYYLLRTAQRWVTASSKLAALPVSLFAKYHSFATPTE